MKTAPISIMGDKANLALSKIKDIHGYAICFYNDVMREELKNEQEIEHTMERALLDGEFKMYLQPKVDTKTCEIKGAEALVRWISPEKGIVSPNKFIPVFEKNGFIEQLDNFMLESACILINKCNRENLPLVPISINQSRQYLLKETHIDVLVKMLEKYNVPHSLIELEVTETAFFDSLFNMSEIVEKLHNLGFTVSMDDFGSGYSSLNMLQNVFVDILKIDKKFFDESIDTKRGKKIVESIISMASDLDIKVVAEGIETSEQVEFLRSTSCDLVQGYYFSKPVPVEEFTALLKVGKIEKI